MEKAFFGEYNTVKVLYKKALKSKTNMLHQVPRQDRQFSAGRWNQEIRLKSGAHPGAVNAGVFYPRRKPVIGQKLRR